MAPPLRDHASNPHDDNMRSQPKRQNPIERNLCYTEDYCKLWTTEEAFRELIQNFLDGICSTFRTSIDKVDFRQIVKGGQGKREWKETWVAQAQEPGEDDRVFGTIRHDLKRRVITITNTDVTLGEEVLLTGFSSKRSAPNQIGGHGEGMKIPSPEILRLLAANSRVHYRTGRYMWVFSLKSESDSKYKTLHWKKSELAERKRKAKDFNEKNLDVSITEIDADKFLLENFPPLSRHLQTLLEASNCSDGQLIESLSQNLASERVYIKGIFVGQNPKLRVSINLARADLNRDRKLVMDDGGLKRALANIWTQTFKKEAELTNKPFTERFLGFALNDIDSVEHQSMDYMGPDAAAYLYDFILEQTPQAFPFKEGSEEEEKLISSSLQKKPYPVSERFLKLLMEHSEVMSVYEAQEEAFLADSAESLPHIYELPLTKMIRAFVTEVSRTPDDIPIEFRKPTRSGIEALFKDGTIFCSESLVDVHFQNNSDILRAKRKAIARVQQELCKGKDADETHRVLTEMMEFVADADFRSFSPPQPESQPHMASPRTSAEFSQGKEQEVAPNTTDSRPAPAEAVQGHEEQVASSSLDNGSDGCLNRFGNKRRLGQVSRGKRTRCENGTSPGHGQARDTAETLNVTEQGTAGTTVTRSTPLVSVPSRDMVVVQPVLDQTEERGVVVRQARGNNNATREHSEGQNATAFRHLVRYALPDYDDDVVLTLPVPIRPQFSIVQNVAEPDSRSSPGTTVNHGNNFQCCRTKFGNILVSVCIQKKTY